MNPASYQSDPVPRLLEAFRTGCRLPAWTPTPGRPVEEVGPVRRQYDLDPAGHFAMIESPRGLGPDPAAYGRIIGEQRDFFAARGQRVEWKTYDTDEPADLPELLVAAGFVPEEPEALVLGDAAPLAEQEITLPDGVVLRPVDSPEDFTRIREHGRAVWGEDAPWVTESLLPDWLADPTAMDVVVVEESRRGPVLCAARSDYDGGFTGLWGGGTLAEWRGRGLYRATLAHRARLGLARGCPFVRIDASVDSEPILLRLGLHRVATTTPYVFTP